MKRRAFALALCLLLVLSGCGASSVPFWLQPNRPAAGGETQAPEEEEAGAGETGGESLLPDGCVLYASETFLPVGEPVQVEFTVRTKTPGQSFEVVTLETGETLALLEPAGMEGEEVLYRGSAQLLREEPESLTLCALGSEENSTEVQLYFAPEVTQQMIDEAYELTDWVAAQVREAYPDGPNEDALWFVADLLESQGIEVEHRGQAVTFTSPNGVGCQFSLPPAEGYFGSFTQDTPLTSAYLTGADCAQLFAYNDGCITNSSVLFLQSEDSLTKTNYHEAFCETLSDFLDGDFDIARERGMIDSLLTGELCDYGTVVLNSHGGALDRSDGGKVGYILLGSDETAATIAELYGYGRCFYDRYETDVDLVRVSTDWFGNHSVCIATDFLMALYADRTFDNTIFYFSVCYLGSDQRFHEFLIDHGAQAVISCPGGLMMIDDYDYCRVLGEYLAAVKEGGSRSYNLGEAFAPGNFLKGNVTESSVYEGDPGLVMQLYTRSTDFAYWGTGELYGHVMGEDGPVEGAEVVVYRYLDHEFVLTDVTRTEADGSFSCPNLTWGTHVFEVKTENARTAAQVNFAAKSEDCGNIYLGKTTESGVDAAAQLENYLRGTLVPQYGWLDIGTWTVVDHYSADADTSRLEGMLSALPADLDGDGQEELLLVRLEQEGGGRTGLYLSVYEAGENGPFEADACYTTTEAFAQNYYDTRVAVFVSENSGGQPCLNLYVNNIMNEDTEVVRTYRYINERLLQTATNAYVLGGDYWAYWYEQDPLADYSYELFPNAMVEENGWTVTKSARLNDDSYSPASIAGFEQEEAAMFEEYRETLFSTAGLQRNARGYIRTEGDAQLAPPERFDNAASFTWAAELYAVQDHGMLNTDPTQRAKRFEAADYSGFGRYAAR